MNAKHVLLSHFSQRYSKFPNDAIITKRKDGQGPIFGYAFDLMRIKMSEFWKLERMSPFFSKVLPEQLLCLEHVRFSIL